ncbi:MAG TPA: hypothetical protein VNW99_14125 [Cytophagaceae bacterium]|jgi:hypothetical protein|nr:hypothetical protein [Cytophagaceae bacterium]
MKRLIFLTLSFSLFIQLTGCISKNEVELYPCDTNNVSYSKNIKPIIATNCYKCHDSNNAPLFANNNHLDSYDSLKLHIKNGLTYNIDHVPGFLAMPKGAPKLADCDIAKIKAWAHQDTLNN